MAVPRQPSMMEPPIEELLKRVDSKFTLVSLSAKRARQINSYFNQLGEGLGAIVPPQVTSVSRKSLSIALEEVVSDKIVPVHHEPAADEALADGSLGEGAAGEGGSTEAGEGV
jgi:DNA-directed RNA polymerase subunit omega